MKTHEALEKLKVEVTKLVSSDEWQRWLQFQGKFHRYSWRNSLLIMMQCPDASQVAGYRNWQMKGRQVRKGEKELAILAPAFVKVCKEVGDEEDERIVTRFRTVYVFDISQTDGEEIPGNPAMQAKDLTGEDRLNLMMRVAESFDLTVGFAKMAGTRKGSLQPSTNEITINSLVSPAMQTKVLVHETAHHVLGHKAGWGSNLEKNELEAESVAYAVTSAMGLDADGYSFAYIANYAGDEALELFDASMSRIKDAINEIMDRVEEA